MNIIARLTVQVAFSKKGRKIITYVVMGAVVYLAIIFGAFLSLLTTPDDIRTSLFGADEIERIGVEALQENAEYSHKIPMIDSLNKITGTYPWPLNGTVTCEYGWRTLYGERDFHGGIDISTGKNDPIISIADGIVERIRIDKNSYGLYVLIKHDDGFYTLSAHLADTYVKEGERVHQGQTIALEGGEPGADPYPGRSTGRHLHFEIRQNEDENARINPLTFLNNN